MLGRVAEWDCFEDYVITGGKPVPAGLHEILQGRHRGDPRFDYSLDTQGRQTRVGFLPLLDKGNRAVGELAVQKDFTCHLATSARTLFAAAALCVLIGGVLFAFFYVFLGRIEEDLASARRIAADESRSREEAQARHIEAVRTHRDQLQAVIDGIPSPLMVIDRNHRILLSNRVVRESAGGVDPARLGLTCHRVSHHRDTPCDGPDDPCPLKIAVEKKSPAQTLHEHYDSKGRAYSVEVAATPVFDEQGEVCQIVESCYDVTERTRAVKTLRLQSSALESAANAIVITDRNGRMTWVNPAFTELSGYSLEEAVDRSPNILRSGKQNEAFYRELWQTILAGRVWRGEMVNRRRDGTFFTVDTTITPVPDESGDINHFIAIQQDVTARKQTEADLEAARQAAEAASRVKSEFLANMSHEIRTPMTAILGFTETLLDTGRTRSDQAKAVETIRSNGEHLLSIINDILDLSKIEAGKMPIEQVACSLPQLLSDVKSLMQPRAAAKGLYLDVDCSESLPEEVLTDPTRLRQILINLIGNAVKFTDSGGVRLVARFVGEERPAMRFDVIDTGIGISPHQAEAIFLPFAQGDTSTARQFGGTGLGLTLSKQFAELLGGDLVLADSQPGVGSRFQFSVAARLPDNVKMIDNLRVAVCQEEAKPPAAETAPIRLSCRVLLAEDGADNQRIISYFLQKAGAEVLVAEHGRLAVDAALAAAGEGRPFDVILMDMQMPVMSGYEAAALLREENYPHPIIAVTAHAMTDDRRKCLEMGCDDYLSKPIRREELLQVVKRHTQLATATEA
jgi:PAS domain S-box-containing protein